MRAGRLLLLLIFTTARSFSLPVGDWDVHPGLRLWGADVRAAYGGVSLIEGLDTFLWLGAGGAFETTAYYRLPDGSDSQPMASLFLGSEVAAFKRINVLWSLGLQQGVAYRPRARKNLVELFLYYRGRYDTHLDNGSLIFQSALADRLGLLQHSLVLGAGYDGVTELIDAASIGIIGGADGPTAFVPSQSIRRGFSAEGSVEWAPPSFVVAPAGDLAFTRLNLNLQGFIPLFAGGGAEHLFSVVLSSRFLADYLFGEAIPLNARQSVGGVSPQAAMGGVMRGIESRRFDSYIKAVANWDLRLNFPPLWIAVPGLMVYFDLGLHDDLQRYLAITSLLATAGGGVVLNAFGLDLGLFGSYFFNESRFSLSYQLGRHY
jgi:hypothetical protein